MTSMNEIQKLFPSMDGNDHQRADILSHFKTILTKIDELKDPNKLTLEKNAGVHGRLL